MPAEAQDAIAEVNRRFSDSFVKRDAAAVAALYTREGQLFPPNSEMVQGHEAIAGFWQFVMGLGIKTVGLSTSELEILGESAVEIGTYTLGGADGSTLDQGTYLVTWKNEGGDWKLHRDIWNTNMPA